MKGKRILGTLFLALFAFGAALTGNAQADINFTLPPDAKFTYSPKSGTAPLIVTFENQSQRADSIEWTLWDRVIDESLFDSSGETIIYQYAYPGTFPIYLTATNEAGTDVAVAYVTVFETDLVAPTLDVDFIAAPRNGPAGTTVQFINLTPGTFTKVLWDFGDNTSVAATEDPSHVYNAPGLYTVSLTLVGPGGVGTETKVNYINIFPSSPSSSMRNPDFVATPATGTSPHMVQFSARSPGETEDVLWDFGDGATSELLNPKHVYEEPGQYTVTLFADGAEVAKSDYVKILSSVEGQMCPAALLLDDDQAQLAILQNFKDNVLAQTLPGLGVIELYNKHSLELVSILQDDEELKEEAGGVLRGLLPGFQSLADGGKITLSTVQVEAIEAVIGKIAAEAGPELEEFLFQMAGELNGGQYLASLCITIAPAE